jgi:hypothetical protein
MSDEVVVQPTNTVRRVEDLTPAQLADYNLRIHRLNSNKSLTPESREKLEEFLLHFSFQSPIKPEKPLSKAQQRAVCAAQDQFFDSFRLYHQRVFHCLSNDLQLQPGILKRIQLNMIALAEDLPFELCDAVRGWIQDQLDCDHTKCDCMSQMYPYFHTLMEREWPPKL